jgi:hypothetical protein
VGGSYSWSRNGNYDVRAKSDQLVQKQRQAFKLPISASLVDYKIPAFHIAQLPQFRAKDIIQRAVWRVI